MLGLIELAALGFAAARVTQLVVWDSILDGWRQRLAAWHMDGIRPGRSNWGRGFIRDLVGCPYCVGFHASWLTVLAYRLATGRGIRSFSDFLLFGIESFAVAGVQMIINRYDDSLTKEGGH